MVQLEASRAECAAWEWIVLSKYTEPVGSSRAQKYGVFSVNTQMSVGVWILPCQHTEPVGTSGIWEWEVISKYTPASG